MKTTPLTTDQKHTLVTIILEANHEILDFELFAEMVLSLSEDIPGLEYMTDEESTDLVNDCWSIYRQIVLSHTGDA